MDDLYVSFGGPGLAGLLVRAVFCAVFLLPPTIMMGATLPAISRWVEATPRGVSWLGFFYGGQHGRRSRWLSVGRILPVACP